MEVPVRSSPDLALAKRLKQTWVRNTKIKSKWKAEKRKQGLSIDGDLSSPVGAIMEETGETYDEDEESTEKAVQNTTETQVIEPPKSTMHPSRAHLDEPTRRNAQTSRKGIREHTESAGQMTPNIRDLTREAYSRSSLHTYRSDPLNRRKQRGREQEGETGGVHRGRGQPNMKLRMGAMLEKIKRDFI